MLHPGHSNRLLSLETVCTDLSGLTELRELALHSNPCTTVESTQHSKSAPAKDSAATVKETQHSNWWQQRCVQELLKQCTRFDDHDVPQAALDNPLETADQVSFPGNWYRRNCLGKHHKQSV